MLRTRMRTNTVALGLLTALAIAAAAHAEQHPQGRVLLAEGTVEVSRDGGSGWKAAASSDPVFEGDLLKTGRGSRAAVLLRDETQLRLGPYSVLEIKRVQVAGEPAATAGGGSGLALSQGQAWVRTKNQARGLAVATPAATAAIRGTELTLTVDGARSELAVIEGLVDFANDQGLVSVGAGEGGRAAVGEAPVKFALIEPANAVQWVLYYPDLEQWPGGDRVSDEVAAAAGALAGGDAAAAAAGLTAALAADPADQGARALLALIQLTQNRPEVAEQTLAPVLAAGEGHALAQLVASKLAQARFDLPAALAHAERAHGLAPDSIEAAASVAELLYGSGRTAEAGALTDQLLARHADSARVQTLAGFVAFGRDEIDAAMAAFTRAVELEPGDADAHLGLGLGHFHRGEAAAGLDQLLTATALAPRRALPLSYLGKGYAEVGRFVEALLTLDTAKRIDPHDPTPHLYAGLILRDLRRHREAAAELAQAIAKNDFRAVYRSRFLLDRDEATRNVSLALLYDEIGFSAYGASLATRSIDQDYGNASAHLFAAGTLINLADRTAAASSELLTARLLQPVNQNAFNTFNDYTSLFVRPSIDLSLRAEAGDDSTRFAAASAYGGNDRGAFFVLADRRENGDQLGPNTSLEQWVGNGVGKLALAPNHSLLIDFQFLDAEQGDPGVVVVGVDPDSPAVIPIQLIRSPDPDPNRTDEVTIRRLSLGYHAALGTAGNLLVVASAERTDFDRLDPDFFAPDFPCGNNSFDESERTGLQALYHTRPSEQHELFVAVDARDREASSRGEIRCDDGSTLDLGTSEVDDRFRSVGGRWVWRFGSGADSSLTLGLRYDEVTVTDTFVDVDPTSHQRVWNPQLGLRLRLAEHFALRLAAFRNLAGHDGDRVEPSLLAGFAIRRNEAERTERDEIDLALDWSPSERMFGSWSVYHREVEAPVFEIRSDGALARRSGRFDVDGSRLELNRRLADRLTGFGELEARSIDTAAFDQRDQQALVGLRYIHPSGWFASLSEIYLRQRYSTAFSGIDLPDTDAWLTDFSIKREFAGKRGRIGLNVRNAFDQDFNVVIEGLSVVQRLPTREASVFVEWLF